MPENFSLTKDNLELVKNITTIGTREPQAVVMSLHHLTYAEANAESEPAWTHFLLPHHVAEQLAHQLLSAVRESAGQEAH